MKLQIIAILLLAGGIATGLAQLGDQHVSIIVTPEGKAKISQSLFPETFVSTIDVHIISEKISNLLAIDDENIILGTTQNEEILKVATLGASSVNLKYNADILSYESGIFKLKYDSDIESRVNLPPLSKLVSLNTIPIEITDEEYVLPPGDISLSFSIRPVTSKEFFIPIDNSEYKIEAITAAKIEQFSANSDEIQFIIKDKAIVLTIIPTEIMANPNDALLNGETADFTQFHKNSTHSWIRIDPHEEGLVKILDTTEKTEDGGGCLIATAIYGSEMAPQVQLLREIRDNQLMNTDSGVSFMTGFNSVYYSFSPYVADLERENALFKEIVKIGITPLLSSLYVMEYAETDEEILGLGISVILMNIGMYFVFPFTIFYESMRFIRTRGVKRSSLEVISNCNVKSVLKIGLVGLIALFVLSVSVPSAFAQSTESEGQNPIRVILDMSYENIQESFADAEMIPTEDPIFRAAQLQYDIAIVALNEGDLETAEESALLAMALFEESAVKIGEILEVQQATIQPLGLSTAAASIFNVQEQITDTDSETNELRELVKLNNYDDVDFSEYDESVNLAKTLLADGFVPEAQAQLALADAIKDNLYNEIANNPKIAEDITEYMDDQKNLGLTKKDIRELESILEGIPTGDNEETGDDDTSGNDNDGSSGKSGEAPGQNKADSGDEAPGNSGEAPGQNKEKDNTNDNKFETAEDIPGFGSASETGKANGQGNGLGLGNIPPGLAKLFGMDDGEISEDLPPGLANTPPGQAKKFQDYSDSFEQSPDDFYENSYESQVDGVFETNYDGTNKGNGDGKGKFGAFPGKSGQAPGQLKDKSDKGGNGNTSQVCHNAGPNWTTLNVSPNAVAGHLGHGDTEGACNNGITDGDAGNTTWTIGGSLLNYVVEKFTAVGKTLDNVTSDIEIDVTAPNGTEIITDRDFNPFNFTPDTNGVWTIHSDLPPGEGLPAVDRLVTVTGGPIADTSLNGNTTKGVETILNGTGSTAGLSHVWELISGFGNPTVTNTVGTPDYQANFTAPTNGNSSPKEYVFELTITNSTDNTYEKERVSVWAHEP